ncbi:hypothetical protein VO54_00849 [Elizabethkingia miricola]|nr:hypothetical protein VO54_00849 [Elizabethkingia miricola]
MQSKLKQTFKVLALLSIISCNYNSQDSTRKLKKKDTLLYAIYDSDNISKSIMSFTVLADSSFIFTNIVERPNYNKIEEFKGLVKIKNNHLDFFPFELDYNKSQNAELKNNYIDFEGGEFPFRMRIEKTKIQSPNYINYSRFPDIAVFKFIEKENSEHYKNYEINNDDLYKAEDILKQCFSDNKGKLTKYSDYVKQINAVKNKQNEIILFVHCYCKLDNFIKKEFRLAPIEMHDGGTCNVYIEINLSKNKYTHFHTAGF